MLTLPHADRDRHLQSQPLSVHVGLDLVALLSEVEVGLGGDEDARDVVQFVLLLATRVGKRSASVQAGGGRQTE